MGNYHISIEGQGAHHNGKEYDADEMARDLVKRLKEKGHSIFKASFTHGACDSLEAPQPKKGDF